MPAAITVTRAVQHCGLGYIHLRASHQWDPAMARLHVIDLALNSLATPASDGTNQPYDLEINSGGC